MLANCAIDIFTFAKLSLLNQVGWYFLNDENADMREFGYDVTFSNESFYDL